MIGLVDGVVGCTLSGRAAFQSIPIGVERSRVPLGSSPVRSYWGPVQSGRIGVQSNLVEVDREQ